MIKENKPTNVISMNQPFHLYAFDKQISHGTLSLRWFDPPPLPASCFATHLHPSSHLFMLDLNESKSFLLSVILALFQMDIYS